MGMPALSDVTTIEQMLALPDDGQRHELLDGVRVVTPSPAYRHQAIHTGIFGHLMRCLAEVREFEVLSSPADIVLGPKTLVQPDLFVIRVNPVHPPRAWADVGVPVLAIEILSPGTATRDRGAKRRIYQRAGVGEYWIVDSDARLVERWAPSDARPEIVEGVLEWHLERVSGTLDFPAVFARALGEG